MGGPHITSTHSALRHQRPSSLDQGPLEAQHVTEHTIASYFAAFSSTPSWTDLRIWPPDVFALTNLLLDHTEAYRYHRKVLQTLQRRERGDRWVLKAPSHLAQLRTLFAVYPDARVVQIHRDPLKSVPSTISLMGTLKSMHSGGVDVSALAPLVSMGYGFMLDDTIDARARGELPDDQFVDVRYADLMADPTAALEQVYRALGVEWSPVTTSTVGSRAVIRGTAASNSSVRCTFASKLPSSPVESVYLKCTKKKS